jgi:hypothetical protein
MLQSPFILGGTIPPSLKIYAFKSRGLIGAGIRPVCQYPVANERFASHCGSRLNILVIHIKVLG